ncbi:MAG: protoporphyrinogen oxidase [Candidatus Neomarinimicrobiota bacterium]
MKVAVLGAGIAGLAAGWTLQRLGQAATVFEAAPVVGGKIQSQRVDGYLLELGPHSIMSSHAALYDALDELGLGEARLVAGPEGRNRFIYRAGDLLPVPLGPAALIRTPLLSGAAKRRLFKEPFIARREDDESVAAFFARRLGPEVVTRLIDPFVSGVYAGDPAKLSVAAAFPRLKEFERMGGSILKGALTARRRANRNPTAKRPKRRRGMYAFPGGLQEVPLALAKALGGDLLLNTPVKELVRGSGHWHVNGERFDALVSTVPLPAGVSLASNLYPTTALKYTQVAVVHLSYPRDAVSARTDGFGVLIPAVEQRRILGILFDSSLFPGRAPDGEHLFTIFMGGERNRWIGRESPENLVKIAAEEVMELLRIAPGVAPLFSHIHVWDAAIPQYGFEHGDLVRQLDELEAAHSTLVFAGNYRQGISVGHAFESGLEAARRLVSRLEIA